MARYDPELIAHLEREGYDVAPVTPSTKAVLRKSYLNCQYGKGAAKHYEEQKERQGGKCAICEQQTEETLHLDHDHESGQLRGLLCRDCNVFLGFARDNPIRLAKAVVYLLEWNPALKEILLSLKKEA